MDYNMPPESSVALSKANDEILGNNFNAYWIVNRG